MICDAVTCSFSNGEFHTYRFVLTFSLGAGPVPSLLLSEIFPSRIRAKAMAVCMDVHWVIIDNSSYRLHVYSFSLLQLASLPFYLIWLVLQLVSQGR